MSIVCTVPPHLYTTNETCSALITVKGDRKNELAICLIDY